MGQGERLPGEGPSSKAQAASCPEAQASSLKLQASSYKLKTFLNFNPINHGPWFMAKSCKLLDLVPWNKFQGPLTKGPDQDKCILRM